VIRVVDLELTLGTPSSSDGTGGQRLGRQRNGAIPGSDEWFVVDMVPGAHPYQELASGLVRIAVDPKPTLAERLEDEDGGLVRVAGEILPPDGSELLLVIDQFEDVFGLVGNENQRARFLADIVAAVSDPGSRVRVIVTLRADFYESLASDTFRFDASDLMPPEIGADRFWKAMMTYTAEGPGSLDRILAELDEAWPDG
jgi:hypothetical protein